MRKKFLLLLALVPTLILAGCSGGQLGNFDTVAFFKNPLVMIVVGAIVLWFAFKGSKH